MARTHKLQSNVPNSSFPYVSQNPSLIPPAIIHKTKTPIPTKTTSPPKLLAAFTSLAAAALLELELALALALLATAEGVIPPATLPECSTLNTLLKYPLISALALALPLLLFVGAGWFRPPGVIPVITLSEFVFEVEVEIAKSVVPGAEEEERPRSVVPGVEGVTVAAGTVVVVAPERIVEVARTVVSAAFERETQSRMVSEALILSAALLDTEAIACFVVDSDCFAFKNDSF